MSKEMVIEYKENCYWYRKQAAKPVDQEARRLAEEQRIAKASKLAAETEARQRAESAERRKRISPSSIAALAAAGVFVEGAV